MPTRLTDAEFSARLQRVTRAVSEDLRQAAERGANGEIPDSAHAVLTRGHKRLSEALDPNSAEGG